MLLFQALQLTNAATSPIVMIADGYRLNSAFAHHISYSLIADPYYFSYFSITHKIQ